MVLKTLEYSGAAPTDYGIARRIEQTQRRPTGGALRDALPGSHETGNRKGFISAEWGISDNHRRASTPLTRAGRKQLEREAREWDRTTASSPFPLFHPRKPHEIPSRLPVPAGRSVGKARKDRGTWRKSWRGTGHADRGEPPLRMTPDHARRAALLKSGGVEPGQRGLPRPSRPARAGDRDTDLLHALHLLSRSPAFTVVAVLSLALGIAPTRPSSRCSIS